ncbi:hypothetical protein [Streptomyces lydicus]|uniref:hypothetical protein n=1 Tax=Streptomyces lydicus TaxID=47763 RepID=UPI003799F0B5
MIPPSRALLESLTAATWLEAHRQGIVAFLLLTHPYPRHPVESPQVIEQRMLGLADAIQAGVAGDLPLMGERIVLSSESEAYLHADNCRYALRIRVGPSWAHVVDGGAPVLVYVGLDPAPPAAERGVARDYVTADRVNRGRLRVGRAFAIGTDFAAGGRSC